MTNLINDDTGTGQTGEGDSGTTYSVVKTETVRVEDVPFNFNGRIIDVEVEYVRTTLTITNAKPTITRGRTLFIPIITRETEEPQAYVAVDGMCEIQQGLNSRY